MTTVVESAGTPAGRVIRAVGGAGEAAAVRQRQAVEQAHHVAQEILAKAEADAAAIRQQAADDGFAAGLAAAESSHSSNADEPLQRHAAALQSLVEQLVELREQWLRQWDGAIVPLAVAMAGRIVRREVRDCPDITLDLVRESLELASSGGRIGIALHSDDCAALAAAVRQLASRLGRWTEVDVHIDDSIVGGGCRLTSEHGEIDQRFATQLARIAEELS